MLNRLFGFDARTMNVRTEVIAGATTFLTMSYVLAVNPTILATTGMDKPALFPDFVIVSPKNLRQRVLLFSDVLPSALFGYKPPCSKVA